MFTKISGLFMFVLQKIAVSEIFLVIVSIFVFQFILNLIISLFKSFFEKD